MKIIFFARLFYPHIGGVEKHVLEVGKRLVKKGHSVTVITENYQSLLEIDKFEGINVIRINVGKEGKFKKFRIWINLIKYLSTIKSADIIHCHDIFFWYLPFRFLFPFKKVYMTFHGYEANETPNGKSILMHKLAEKLSKGNICIGNFYKKWYGTKATFISFGAVDDKLVKEGLILKKPTKDAMFLGRLEEETGIMEYLKAIKNLNIKLDVFGDGSLKNKASKYVKDNSLKVSFKGFVNNATEYIKDYKYVFTSRYLGILEAMAVKRPVFAIYNNAIKKDYLEETSFFKFISISKESKEIDLAVKKYITNENTINVGKAYDWVKKETWENMVKVYLNLWVNDK